MTEVADRARTVMITVDGAELVAAPGELLIAACERSGVYIPRFCYHRRMSSVGMCRVCLVEVDTGQGPALQPSCMLTVSDGMTVSTNSQAAAKAQDGVLEFLLINHPLDCPVCDKGGECPLQDQTMAYGPGESRFVEEKRHFEKPIAISDTVYLDRERCILCDRCTRFADEVAGDALIHFMGRGGHTEVNTFPDEPFASYFSGNTVQICPVGALTAVPYRFKARPWDLTEAVSTAWVDSVGARISVQASRNRVLRLLGVDCDAVNWGWLSDKERFAFEALNSPRRLRGPLIRARRRGRALPESAAPHADAKALKPGKWGEALARCAEALGAAPPERIGVLGGARLTNEAQYAWAKLAKGVLGTDNVDAQLGDGLDPDLVLGLPQASIADACKPGGTVVLLGPDPKEELGSLYLRLRHAAVHDGATLIEIAPCDGGLTSAASHSLRPLPGETAELVRNLVANDADASAPVRAAALALADAESVTVILGRPSLAEPAAVIAEAALAFAELPSVRFLPALRRGNVRGALEAGLAPGLLPGGAPLDQTAGPLAAADVWPRLPSAYGLGARGILNAAAGGGLDVLVLLGTDPLNDFEDRLLAYRGLLGAGFVLAVDLFVNDSAALAADVVLAAAGPTECEGTFTNLEGRVSVMAQKVTPPGTARPDWVIAAELAARLGRDRSADLGFDSSDDIRAEMAHVSRSHQPLRADALRADPVEGVLLSPAAAPPVPQQTAAGSASAASPAETPGSLRLVATRSMYDDGVMLRHCPSLRGLARSAAARVHPDELTRLGLAPGAPVRVVSARGDLDAELVADAGVPAGVLAVGWLAPGAPANALIQPGTAFTPVVVSPR